LRQIAHVEQPSRQALKVGLSLARTLVLCSCHDYKTRMPSKTIDNQRKLSERKLKTY
jgi:hypothetical protein